MISLVLKDLLVQKKTFIVAFLYSIFVFFAFGSNMSTGVKYVMGCVAIAYLFIMYAVGYDDKNKCEIMLNSLPIKRTYIVYAKYTSIIVFMIIAIAFTSIVGGVLKLLGFPLVQSYIAFTDIIGVIAATTLLAAIYYPVYFKLGYMKAKYVNMFIFFGVFFLPGIIMKAIAANANNSKASVWFINIVNTISIQPDWVIVIYGLIGISILMLTSLMISLNIYVKKDF